MITSSATDLPIVPTPAVRGILMTPLSLSIVVSVFLFPALIAFAGRLSVLNAARN